MNVTLTSLEALILKATHESLPCPDAAALEAFCTIMRDSAEGPMLAAQTLAARIHSSNAREALLALSMLDRCMRRCDAAFHAEVGKFRFLNELIKLVSPKYYADKTAPEVRTRVLQLLHAWSTEFPKETKFKVAYDMLKNQGVVTETPPPLPAEESTPPCRVKSVIFDDADKSRMLQKLLQSKKPEDILSANKLIKTMVREEERRNEANSRRALEVSSALDSAGLLQDMLVRASDATPDETQLIHELRARCARMRPTLQKMAASDPPGNSLGEILHACDILDEVFQKYNRFVAETKNKTQSQVHSVTPPSNDSLLDFAGAGEPSSSANVIDGLGDIFTTDGPGAPGITEPLKPVTLAKIDDVHLLGDKPSKAEGWNELDTLGEQLLKQSLPENAKRVENFNSKQSKKIPMNTLEKCPKKDTQSGPNSSLLDLDFFNDKPDLKTATNAARSVTPNDDVMVDISTTLSNTSSHTLAKPDSPLDNIIDLSLSTGNRNNETEEYTTQSSSYSYNIAKRTSDIRPLTDINLTLESVHPNEYEEPETIFKGGDGLTVTLHFCKDKPRSDVYVIVISTTSNSRSPIEHYKFQAMVPKGCKCRLLSPSSTSLPAFNPFLPPPALTQILLVYKPPQLTVTLKYVLTYSCDGETCSEMGETVTLPLLED